MDGGRHILLLTGAPGIGKTTIVRRVAAGVSGQSFSGFYTEEIREGRRRVGFRLLTFDGRERVMAHVDFRGPHRVGRYGVDVSAIDDAVDAIWTPSGSPPLFIVDEIGKMECFSAKFVEMMRALFQSNKSVLATVAARGGGLIAEAKRVRGAELWEVTRDSREELVERIGLLFSATSGSYNGSEEGCL